ncbi:YbaB/EbfC family nucleoid-associated protein [Streptomyces sp. 21So2-11]|uniref:YbaB/EbfC family nucleoid-associated protein n=1 Tax=Streptomyces sp. 21So2-11 TaxID=3144408 RepID=UPI003219AC3F
MSNPMEEHLAEALAEFEETRAKLSEAGAAAARISATVMSKDRSVEATVGAQGQLTNLRFPSTQYRTMPPAQLASVLMATIGAARTQATEQLMDVYRPFGPIPGMSPTGEASTGGDGFQDLNWEELFAPLREEGLPTPPVKAPSAKSSGALLDELVEDEGENGAAGVRDREAGR